MSYKNSIKVLLGTTLKQLKTARLTGNLCMTELYLLNIINKFIYDCTSCPIDSEILKKLKKLARDLQNKTSYICNIRSAPENNIFKYKNKNINNFFGEMATFNINTDAEQNLPPSEVGDGQRTTPYNTAIVFTRADFTTNTTPPYADPEGDAAGLLKILALPSTGELRLNGVLVGLNQIIGFGDIDNGLFTFVPAPNLTTAQTGQFSFAIADTGSNIFTS